MVSMKKTQINKTTKSAKLNLEFEQRTSHGITRLNTILSGLTRYNSFLCGSSKFFRGLRNAFHSKIYKICKLESSKLVFTCSWKTSLQKNDAGKFCCIFTLKISSNCLRRVDDVWLASNWNVLHLTACNQKKTFLLKLFFFAVRLLASSFIGPLVSVIGQDNLEMILP